MTKSDSAGKRKSNTQIAIEEIKRLIIENELPAGSNHLEGELSKKLGMSRTPVREATLVLEAQGLLKVQPRRGVLINSLSPRDMGEIYQVLTALEGLSAQLAAHHGWYESELESAQKSIEEMDRALETDDRETWAIADEAFHKELVRLGGNTRIMDIVDMHHDQVRRVRSVTLYKRPSPVRSNDEHRMVLEAIRCGDGDAANTLHAAHRTRAGTMLINILSKHELK